jgi:signal transduction histidine kinase
LPQPADPRIITGMAAPSPTETADRALTGPQIVLVASVFSLAISLPGPMGMVLAEGWRLLPQALLQVAQSTVFNTVFVSAMLAVLVFGHQRLRRRGMVGRALLLGLVAQAVVAGVAAQWLFHVMATDGQVPNNYAGFAYEVQRLLTVSLLFAIAYDHMVRARQTNDALHRTQLHRLQLDRELDNAHLQLLQAQVEPHFLFNTLANLRRLVRTEPSAAQAMLADLLRYLAEALPRLRDERSTVARELALVRAYLALHQVRMGSRLKVTIDAPDAVADLPVPPMVLLTLVENAIKHGIGPQVEGGEIRVQAQRQPEGPLMLSVTDTGRGLVAGSGHGSGLANLRARLKALYGQAAALSLTAKQPQGVVATVILPAEALT